MRFQVTIKQVLEGCLVVEAESAEEAVATAEHRNEEHCGWDEVVDGDGFLLIDEAIRADQVGGDTPLTSEEDDLAEAAADEEPGDEEPGSGDGEDDGSRCPECGHDFTEADIDGGRCLSCGWSIVPLFAAADRLGG
jgi:hypothetical protein